MNRTSRVRGLLAAFLLACLMLVGASAPAQAALSAGLTTAAPNDTSAMAYSNYVIDSTFGPNNDDVSPRSLQFDLPKGQLGAVQNATICTDANFNNDNCAASSKIGEVLVNGKAVAIGFVNLDVNAVGGIYRLATTGTEAARIGIVADDPNAHPLFITGVMRVRNDYGITAYVPNVPDTATADLFGVSADVDVSRMLMTLYGRVGGGGSGNGFMFNPGECIAATTVVRAYPSANYAGTVQTGNRSYTPTNCAGAPFNPSIAFNPNPAAASTPTAFSVVASQPYNATDAKVGSPFKNVTMTLPDGVQLTGATNSDGSLVACTDAQFGASVLTPDTCPAGARVGSVTMDSPLVGSIPGDVFIAQPSAGPNNIVRLFMVAELGTASDAVRVKLVADVAVDPTTGATTTTLVNLPAQPVRSFTFTFRAGTNPATRNPRMCGTYAGSGALTSYSSATAVNRSANYVVSTSCPAAGRFRPTIAMSTSPTKAGGFTTGTTTIDLPVGDEPYTKLKASLPAGMIANINGVTRCTIAQAAADSCAAGTAVGTVSALAGQSTVPGSFTGTTYLTDAPDSQSIAGLYIRVPVVVGPIVVDTLKIQAAIRLRTDFGIDVVSDVPATVRGLQLDMQRLQLVFNKANFLVNPPVCTGNSVSGDFTSSLGTNATNSSVMSVTGCASVLFAPTLAFTAAPASAGGASSFTASVNIPASAPGAEQSAPKTIAIKLPTGVSLSPSASSDGSLVGCTDAQFTISTFADPTCPAGSNVGAVSIDTPSVGHFTGTAYLGTAVSGHTARLLVDAKSDTYGALARVKLEGLIDVDGTTGDTTTTFDNLPKAQFTSFSITLRGGTKPVLSMPRTCGTYNGSSTMTPWTGGANATPPASITLNQNCTDSSSFAPTLGVTIAPTGAGKNSTLTTQIDVPERHRPLDQLTLNLPAGLLANIDGAPRCTIAAATAGTCAAATKIGTVSALAGQGTTPGSFSGELFLTDAPTAADVVGIAVKLPAVVGPVDLGNVTTIASVKLRPSDYGIDVTAAIPTSQKGVPLHLRRLVLAIDKSGFLTNPVTCGATLITSTLHGAGGSTVSPSVPFTPTGCASLGFNPTVAFSAAPATAAGASALTTTITAPASTDAAPQAAMKKAVVDLPAGVSLSSSINSANDLAGCTAAQFTVADFADPTCPAGSAVGTATIVVPQVGTLTGNVYLAQTAPGTSIAGLYLDAKSTSFGAAVRVKLAGQVDVDATTGKTTATFDNAPAVAFSSFALAMRGGTKPALSVPRACGTTAGVAVLTPQSGTAASRTGNLVINAGCGNENAFAPTGSVTLSTLAAGQDASLTTVVNVPSGGRELAHVDVSLPAGLLANIQGKTRCTVAQAQAGTCAAATEIGTVTAEAGQGTTPGTFSGGKVYLVDAPSSSDVVGLGISIPVQVGPVDLGKVNVVGTVKLRGDYGIDISADVPTSIKGIPMYLRKLTIAITKSGLLFNPSTCGSKTATLSMRSASYSGATSTGSDSSTFTIANCAALGFDPSIAFSGSPSQAGGASAFTTTVNVPSAPAQSSVDRVDVNLPTGVSLSPSINSDGALVGCTDAQFDLATTSTVPACATASKVGTVAIATGSVGALAGDVYLADTAPGHIARVFVYAVAANYPGVKVKLTGTVDVDSSTGVASASFTGLPDVPFTSFAITFRGGTSPVISMPRTCGTPTGSAVLTPKSGGTNASRTGTLTVDQQCADTNSFAPTFTNTIAPTTAGVSSTLTSTINVPQRHRALDQLTLNLPAGMIANVNGATRCSIAAANAGTCAAASKIGTVVAKAGQGTTPATFNGELFLTDAPTAADVVGIAVRLPAVAGPVDLGLVTTVASVKLRPADYGVDVVAAIPTSVKGIPLHLQQLQLVVNKAGFLTNPTSCSASSTTAVMRGQGAAGTVTSNAAFTATGCAGLGFAPTVAFGAAPAQAAGASSFTTTITAPAGTDAAPQAALKKAVVDLPTGTSLSASINSDSALVGCTAAQFSQSDFSDPT
ncbi:MAG: hypothetical protein J7513_01220, partial [Solirubrobacteraceae bacterium]|nr:hypothetical protein [Solirubrobacteraceae bacterium]